VLTVLLVGELCQVKRERAWLRQVRASYGRLFPHLPEDSRFARRAKAVRELLRHLRRAILLRLLPVDRASGGSLVDWFETFAWVLAIVKKPAGQQGFAVLPKCWIVETASHSLPALRGTASYPPHTRGEPSAKGDADAGRRRITARD
jgi:hypothetical protein